MTLQLSRTMRWVVLFGAFVTFTSGFVDEASGQANSDYYAYPRGFLGDMGTLPTSSRQLTFNRMPGLSPDYKLGPGDKIEVVVVDESQFVREITPRGEISIPFVGSVNVADLTAEEAEARIASAMREKKLIKSPQVLVSVTEYGSKTVYALGELDRPGEYRMSFQMTLMDFVFVSGGIDFTATRYAYLYRRTSDAPSTWRPVRAQGGVDSALLNQPDEAPPGTELVKIDLQPMKDGGVLQPNLVLRDGDIFYVPRKKLEFVYLIGDVHSPGAYELPNLQRVTASQAIAFAGGPTKVARVSKSVVVRHDSNGQRHELPVDFNAILRGDQPDFEILPEDVVFIPGSSGRQFGGTLLNMIPTLTTYLLIF
jgi:polysaccharide export outer membrane protein